MTRVLILDANQRPALAATRSLGKRRIPVVAADETRHTLAGSSKYCEQSFTYPSPWIDPDGFIAVLKRESVARQIGIIFPMTELSTSLVLKHRQQFSDIRIPFAPWATFDTLSDKRRLCQLARQLEVPIPTTHFADGSTDLDQLSSRVTFPAVLKPCRSRLWAASGCFPATVRYADSAWGLKELVARHRQFSEHPFLVQEYIAGQAAGIFALYDHGRPVVFFAHRRLREKPPSGGVSVLSESVAIDARLRELAQRILDAVHWHGVAMVEFKLSLAGRPYLIEVNARFWGSLQLAIDAGVDFPHLLYTLAVGDRPPALDDYRLGIRSRWLLGDLDHLYLTFRDHAASRWSTLRQFLNFIDPKTKHEVNRWGDLRPFLHEIKHYLAR